jgi:hypothetical protein
MSVVSVAGMSTCCGILQLLPLQHVATAVTYAEAMKVVDKVGADELNDYELASACMLLHVRKCGQNTEYKVHGICKVSEVSVAVVRAQNTLASAPVWLMSASYH